ncbi:MBL fold metallo-hydrolase [Burkholderia sp. LMG 21824]|uniref:MBL fold metallo-hydrolase n=1 Tax=Burkholderia sp. LMG 21824 TaxID=3158172 RepID=UPI003C2CF895
MAKSMRVKKQYLKSNVVCEPLFNGWYAWTQLIAPHTASQHISQFQIPVMESFIDSPEVHIEAVKNPAMLGGPFVDLDETLVPAVKNLLTETNKNLYRYIELGKAITDGNRIIDKSATGYSVDQLYSKLPDQLRGLVEIVYDDDNHPSMRFIEALLYGENGVYDERHQSLLLSTVESDYRSFILTTPRIESEQQVRLDVPFKSRLVDRLFSARNSPVCAAELASDFGLEGVKRSRFLELFTDEAPAGDGDDMPIDGLRIRYLGHACLLMQTAHVSILVDPTISYRHQVASSEARYTIDDLPPHIDYVLLTHDHQDHVCLEFLLQLRHRIGMIVVPRASNGTLLNPSLKRVLSAIGFSRVTELDELESIDAGGLCITGLPFFGEHGDLGISTKLAYHVRGADRSILCLADSRNVDSELYRRLHKWLGDVDVVFIGMECDGAPMSWLYGPLLRRPIDRRMDQTRRLNGSNSREAFDIVTIFRCRMAYVYAMGQEPWLGFLTTVLYTEESIPIIESNRFVNQCRDAGIDSERLYCKKEIQL